jgi:acyl carrier protein
MEFEKEFNLTIDESDADKIQTVGSVVGYLQEKLG